MRTEIKKEVKLSQLELLQVKACILLAITDWEREYIKNAANGGEDYEILERIYYYRRLAEKFDLV